MAEEDPKEGVANGKKETLDQAENTAETTKTTKTEEIKMPETKPAPEPAKEAAATENEAATTSSSTTTTANPPATITTEAAGNSHKKEDSNNQTKNDEDNNDSKPAAAIPANVPPAVADNAVASESHWEGRFRGGGGHRGGGGRNSRRHGPYRGGRGGAAAPQAAPMSDEDRSRRIYVGNLAWSVSWQDLKDHFKATGHDVTRADIMMSNNGRSKGCGIVEFATAESASQAVLTLNDTELHGRQIFVREDREERGSGDGSAGGGGFGSFHQHQPVHPSGGSTTSSGGGSGHRFSSGEQAQNRRVYVGNLSWDVAWQDLKDHMRQAGEVIHAEVITEANGRSKGCGIVEYATPDEAEEAIKSLTDTELKGRMIFVREDRETSSGSTGGFHGGGSGGSGGGGAAGRSQTTSVYVWNLDYKTSWQDLKDHARKAGNVDQAIILTDPEGNSIGCGIVVYQRPQDAARAIRELQNSELNGRPMYLREDRVQSGRGYGGGGGGGATREYHGGGGGHHHHQQQQQQAAGEPGCQLFVSNLSYDTTWRELKDHFRQCGEVERAEVMETPDGKKKGFGTVRFYTKSDAEGAIARMNGVELLGRALEVRLDSKAN
jgi:RNA recognition motif-containing protein